jgi:hypothetical protein
MAQKRVGKSKHPGRQPDGSYSEIQNKITLSSETTLT